MACVVIAATGCGGSAHHARASSVDTPSASPVSPTASTSPVPRNAYSAAVDAAHADGLQVWLETSLVGPWKAGKPTFDAKIKQLAALAREPGVIGVKVADELGQVPAGKSSSTDVASSAEALAFLHDTRAAFAAELPGTKILIDVIGFQLECADGVAPAADSGPCDAQAQATYPGMTLDTVDAIVSSGDVDVVDLTTNLGDQPMYQKWGITRAQAEQAAIKYAVDRGWAGKVVLQTRKALAFPTDKLGTAEQAADLVPDFVTVPVAAGAAAVDIWSWGPTSYSRGGVTYQPKLMAGLKPNALWTALKAEHDRGVKLFTHFTPSSVVVDTPTDMRQIATVFSGVFIAAGVS